MATARPFITTADWRIPLQLWATGLWIRSPGASTNSQRLNGPASLEISYTRPATGPRLGKRARALTQQRVARELYACMSASCELSLHGSCGCLFLVLRQPLFECLFPPIDIRQAALLPVDERVRPFADFRVLFLHVIKRRARPLPHIARENAKIFVHEQAVFRDEGIGLIVDHRGHPVGRNRAGDHHVVSLVTFCSLQCPRGIALRVAWSEVGR